MVRLLVSRNRLSNLYKEFVIDIGRQNYRNVSKDKQYTVAVIKILKIFSFSLSSVRTNFSFFFVITQNSGRFSPIFAFKERLKRNKN